MVEEIFDRAYRSGREPLNASIDRALNRIRKFVMATFVALHDIQFDAPWTNRAKVGRCG